MNFFYLKPNEVNQLKICALPFSNNLILFFAAYKWVQSSAYASIPANAVVAGNDEDGAITYVGRATHEGEMLVCKVIPSKQIGFVSTRGVSIPKDTFEILCGQNFAWIQCYDHVIPENAVLCARTSLDQPIYIGRGHYEGCLAPGKISSVHRALFIPFRGAERRLESYEILVEERRTILVPGWSLPDEKPEKCPMSPPPPPPPLSGATSITDKLCPYPYPLDSNAPPYPIDDLPPMYTPTPQPYYPPPPSQPIVVVPVAPIVPADTYIPPSNPYNNPPAFIPASTYQPTTTPAYSPPSTHNQDDLWVNATSSYTPPNAVTAGHDTDLSTILVCRAYHNGSFIPGKALPERGFAYISDAGQEIPKSTFEILVGNEKYYWMPSTSGSIPSGAVLAGRSSSGEPLYVGRAHYCGSLTSGKVHPSHGCLYIPFGGSERRITNYEVLVRKNQYYREEVMKIAY